MRRSWLALSMLVLPLAGCARTSAPSTAAVGPVLDSLLREHGQYAVTKNVDGLLSHYTTDAVVRSNHVEPLRGQAALRAFLSGMLAAVDIQALTYRTEGLAVYGDSAWQIATYQMAGKMANQPLSDHGSVMVLWRRDGTGAWRIQEDIVNSSVPLAPAASR
jgi:ketosteroid isomerase-like protein